MSPGEYEAMGASGRVLEGAGGQTFAALDGPTSFGAQATKGSVYVEFDVPTSSLLSGGKEGWVKMIGPSAARSQQFMLTKQGGEMLPAWRNLSEILKVK